MLFQGVDCNLGYKQKCGRDRQGLFGCFTHGENHISNVAKLRFLFFVFSLLFWPCSIWWSEKWSWDDSRPKNEKGTFLLDFFLRLSDSDSSSSWTSQKGWAQVLVESHKHCNCVVLSHCGHVVLMICMRTGQVCQVLVLNQLQVWKAIRHHTPLVFRDKTNS